MALADSPFISEARQEDNDWNDKSSAWLFCRILNNQGEKLNGGVARAAAHQFFTRFISRKHKPGVTPWHSDRHYRGCEINRN